jgi:hypothetical protein
MNPYYYYLFFPADCSFGQLTYKIVSSGFELLVSTFVATDGCKFHSLNTNTAYKTYYECVKYEDGRFDEALFKFCTNKGIELEEAKEDNRPPERIMERFLALLEPGQKPDVIRIFVRKQN